MKNLSIHILKMLFVVSVTCLPWFTPPLDAQIGPSPNATNTPNYGIYGSAPTPETTPFPCGTPRYVRLATFPSIVDDEGNNADYIQTLPLNGLKNFNFYYTADGTAFVSGGGYRVTYLNASQSNCYGIGNVVTYSPNSAHTNGVQVRPFNGSLTTPRGIHGIFLVKIPGGGGTTAPLQNANAWVTSNNGFLTRAKTNGIGYFSIYYDRIASDGFLPDGSYYYHVSGLYNNCTFTFDDDLGADWHTGTGGPDDTTYYVDGLEYDFGTKIITSTVSGCTP